MGFITPRTPKLFNKPEVADAAKANPQSFALGASPFLPVRSSARCKATGPATWTASNKAGAATPAATAAYGFLVKAPTAPIAPTLEAIDPAN